jgi:hypothetical protein
VRPDDVQKRISALIDEVVSYYAWRDRHCAAVGSEIVDGQTYSVDFLIDRRLLIRCQMPIDKRNLMASLLLGIGPHFIHPLQLMDYDQATRYCTDEGGAFVMRNLRLLDEHLASGAIRLVALSGTA